MLNKEKGTLCEGVGIHRTIMLKEHTLTLSCIVTLPRSRHYFLIVYPRQQFRKDQEDNEYSKKNCSLTSYIFYEEKEKSHIPQEKHNVHICEHQGIATQIPPNFISLFSCFW